MPALRRVDLDSEAGFFLPKKVEVFCGVFDLL
jgi:hypothetical protein